MIFFWVFLTEISAYLILSQWGTFISDMPESQLLLITAEEPSILQIGFEAPDFPFINGTKNTNCESLHQRLLSQGNLEVLRRKFFIHKFYEYLRKDFDSDQRDLIFEIFSNASAINETFRPVIENQFESFEPVKVEETTVSSSLVTPWSTRSPDLNSSASNSTVDMLESDLKRVKDLLESEKISDIGAKMAVESPLFAFDRKNDTYFTFREFPVSKNNKVYRTLSFKTKMSLKFLIILMSDSFVPDLDNNYPNVVVMQKEGSGRSSNSRLCKFRNVTLVHAGQQSLIFGCHSTEKETEYTVNLRFESSADAEKTKIFELYMEGRPIKGAELSRSRRQFGEVLSGILIGGLGFSGIQKFFNPSAPVANNNAAVSKNFKLIVESERENFQKLTTEICSNEKLSEHELLQEYLDNLFSHFISDFEFTLLSSSLKLRSNKILNILSNFCRSMNPSVDGRTCDEFFEIAGKFKFVDLSVPDEKEILEKNVALHVTLKVQLPIFGKNNQKISQIFSVPMYINNTFPYEFKQIVNLPQYVSRTSGGIFVSLDSCLRTDSKFFCDTRSLTKVLSKDDCLNTLMNQERLKCKISYFTSNNDCFFRLVNETFLLSSSTGEALLLSERPQGPLNQKWTPTQKRRLRPFETLHNINDFSILCNSSSYRGSLIKHSLDVHILGPKNPSPPPELKTSENLTLAVFSEPSLKTFTSAKVDSGSPFFNWLHTFSWWKQILIWFGVVISAFLSFITSCAIILLIAKTIFKKIIMMKDFSLKPVSFRKRPSVGKVNTAFLPGMDYEVVLPSETTV